MAPVTYGEGSRPPRGDYERARADYTCAQAYDDYTEADHDTYRRLYARQLQQLPGLACDEFIAAVGATRRARAHSRASRRSRNG